MYTISILLKTGEIYSFWVSLIGNENKKNHYLTILFTTVYYKSSLIIIYQSKLIFSGKICHKDAIYFSSLQESTDSFFNI